MFKQNAVLTLSLLTIICRCCAQPVPVSMAIEIKTGIKFDVFYFQSFLPSDEIILRGLVPSVYTAVLMKLFPPYSREVWMQGRLISHVNQNKIRRYNYSQSLMVESVRLVVLQSVSVTKGPSTPPFAHYCWRLIMKAKLTEADRVHDTINQYFILCLFTSR